jgi:hypothetical protein
VAREMAESASGLAPWPQQGQLASPRAEETSSHEKGLSGYGTNGHAYDRGLAALTPLPVQSATVTPR